MHNGPAAEPQDTGLDTITSRFEEMEQRLGDLDRKLDWIIRWIIAEQDDIPAPPAASDHSARTPSKANEPDTQERSLVPALLLTSFSAAKRLVGVQTGRGAPNQVDAGSRRGA